MSDPRQILSEISAVEVMILKSKLLNLPSGLVGQSGEGSVGHTHSAHPSCASSSDMLGGGWSPWSPSPGGVLSESIHELVLEYINLMTSIKAGG